MRGSSPLKIWRSRPRLRNGACPLFRRLRRTAVALAVFLLLAWIGYGVLCVAFPFPQERLVEVQRARVSPRVLDREGEPLRAFISPEDTWLLWVSADEVSPHLIAATLAVEDKRFFRHPGVDPRAVARAAWSNVRAGRIVSGASTLTMQVQRLLDDRPRTFRSKAVEAFRALQFDRLHNKRRTLEWYLNLAPYGSNLLGVEAASRRYFGKGADDLTLDEAALLAGLPQSPSRLRPDRHPERARWRRDHVLGRMRACGFISETGFRAARARPVRAGWRPLAFEAAHFARMALRRRPGAAVLRTTLDRRLQALAEAAVREGVAVLRPQGVTNGAAVIIENRTAAVRALVGSCDFWSVEDHGQVNGATAVRSPGSALKPFTYAAAFEWGVCAPSTALADVPASFAGYRPSNYDGHCRGPVPAAEALRDSLNLPAVRLLQAVGAPRLAGLLRDAGLPLRGGADRHGLSLTLGSAGTTLLDLTNAYAALARLGVYRPYRLLEDEPAGRGRRVLSQAACYVLAEVLSEGPPPDGAAVARTAAPPVRMAWKTGTSYGHRDAWTVAYTPAWTVGVWMGNFSGRPSRALVGVEAAAPVAARIVRRIEGRRPAPWYGRPEGVGMRTVCAVSGMPAGPQCPATRRALYLPGRSPSRRCTVHRCVAVDRRTGARLCAHCMEGREHEPRVVEVWPVELDAWMRVHQPGRPLAPPHLAECGTAAGSRGRPHILSPAPDATYVLTLNRAAPGQRLLLRAAGRTRGLYWFVDGALHARAAPLSDVFWPLRRGTHTITCSDEAGRGASVTIHVR